MSLKNYSIKQDMFDLLYCIYGSSDRAIRKAVDYEGAISIINQMHVGTIVSELSAFSNKLSERIRYGVISMHRITNIQLRMEADRAKLALQKGLCHADILEYIEKTLIPNLYAPGNSGPDINTQRELLVNTLNQLLEFNRIKV